MATPKKDKKQPTTKGFEVEAGQDNPQVPVEDAVMADDQVEEPEKSKGLSIFIDLEHDPEKEPEKNNTTKVGFVLNEKAVTLTTIADKIAEFEKIEINGFLDKKNYQLVQKAKSELLKTRTTLGKVAKADVIDPVNAWLKQYKSDLDEVSAALLAGQQKMEAKLKEIDDAFELEQQRLEKEAQDRIQGRVSGLFNLGASFNEEAGFYMFPYNEALIINTVQLKDWDDVEYGVFIDEVVESWNIDQTRIRQEEEAAEAEKNRILDLAKEQEAQKALLDEKLIKLRHKELKLAGAELIDDKWMVRGEAIDPEWITGFDDERWDILIQEIETPIEMNEPTPSPVEGYIPEGGDIDAATEEVAPSEMEVEGHSGPVSYGGGSQTSGFNIEGEDEITDIELEESETVTEVDFDDDIRFELLFKSKSPFINHHFLSTTLRVFLPEYEMQANDGVAPADLKDAGPFGDTGLQYILIKRPK